ncbi:MAG: UDP-N-acetylmuramoyl-tripeptide--D-alanyl-D-alanine ligase [Pirellulales bacterium]|nr:UDP-N-acetylmuramoyl-tripeptide--D-alanyl-D-alanine ligase [Pirellulales bacterium]
MSIGLKQLVEAVGGELRPAAGGLEAAAWHAPLRVVTHSAAVQPGDVFWALRGAQHEGSRFAQEAFARGAAGVVADREGVAPPTGHWTLQVPDALAALGRLAAWCRHRFSGPVIAVTGSHGKTTTRELIAQALAPKYQVCRSPANWNNHVGLPLAMLGLSDDPQAAVFELGASAVGEIARLAELCRPQIGVITALGEAHLASFGGLDEIARAKWELVESLPAGGLAVLNGDCERLRRNSVPERISAVWQGRAGRNDLRATDIAFTAGALRLTVDGTVFRVPVWGRHHLGSVLAAVAVARHLGVPLGSVAESLAEFEPPSMRGRVLRCGGLRVIDDTYNASPSTMRAALDLLGEVPADGRRIFVCGDMLELGAESPSWHRRLGHEAVTRGGVDRLIAVGEFAADVAAGAVDAGLPHRSCAACATIDEAYYELTADLQPGDWVTVKGSRAMRLEILVERLREALLVMDVRLGRARRSATVLPTLRLASAA